MNTAKIYATAAGKTANPETVEQQTKEAAQKAADESARKIALAQWLEHPFSKQFVNDAILEIEKLDALAREQAFTYYSHKNHDVIINTLIQAQTLRNVLNKLEQ